MSRLQYAVSLWMRGLLYANEDGATYTVADPRVPTIELVTTGDGVHRIGYNRTTQKACLDNTDLEDPIWQVINISFPGVGGGDQKCFLTDEVDCAIWDTLNGVVSTLEAAHLPAPVDGWTEFEVQERLGDILWPHVVMCLTAMARDQASTEKFRVMAAKVTKFERACLGGDGDGRA